MALPSVSKVSTRGDGAGRRMPVIGFVAVVIVYLAILQALPFLLPKAAGSDKYATFTTVDSIVKSLIIPVGASVVFGIIVVSVLGWWRPVLADDRPVRRWVWIVPIVMVVAIAAGINYRLISDRGGSVFGLLLVGCLLVGVGEELMYRGIGVVTFRNLGFTENKVALWTTVIFALSHATNLISEGPKAFVQVLITAIAGYFFYLIRRVSGTLLLGMVLHGLWDFGLTSTAAATTPPALNVLLFVLADIVLAIVVLIRRHHINISPTAA